MSEMIRAYPTGFGTTDWRVEFADGRYICDLRLVVSSMLNASRYYVLHDGVVAKEGTFNFGLWDETAVRELVTAIVRSMYPNANVDVELPRQRRSAGA